MMRTTPKSRIHRTTVTQADLHHVGSVTVDEVLRDPADRIVELGADPAAPSRGDVVQRRGDVVAR